MQHIKTLGWYECNNLFEAYFVHSGIKVMEHKAKSSHCIKGSTVSPWGSSGRHIVIWDCCGIPCCLETTQNCGEGSSVKIHGSDEGMIILPTI